MRSSPQAPTEVGTPREDEAAIVRSAFDRLTSREDVKVACNVPMLGRCADMVYMKGRSVFSIEFKLRDWRRAIKQARDHRLAADYVYVCMPRRANVDAILPEARAAGVGFMFYDDEATWPFEVVEKAPRSEETWSVAHSQLREYLHARNGSWL